MAKASSSHAGQSEQNQYDTGPRTVRRRRSPVPSMNYGEATSTTVGAFFLAVGVGAILQVDWEIARLVRDAGGRVASATNLLAFLVGFGIMYATDLLVAL